MGSKQTPLKNRKVCSHFASGSELTTDRNEHRRSPASAGLCLRSGFLLERPLLGQRGA